MLKKWKTAAIVFGILFVATLVITITNHYYGWIETVISAFTPVEETSTSLASIFAPIRNYFLI